MLLELLCLVSVLKANSHHLWHAPLDLDKATTLLALALDLLELCAFDDLARLDLAREIQLNHPAAWDLFGLGLKTLPGCASQAEVLDRLGT